MTKTNTYEINYVAIDDSFRGGTYYTVAISSDDASEKFIDVMSMTGKSANKIRIKKVKVIV